METFREEPEALSSKNDAKRISFSGLIQAIKRPRRDKKDGWIRDPLSFVPLYDRPAPVSLSPSADGPIATLARVELNARRGRPLDEGLDSPDQLNQPGAP